MFEPRPELTFIQVDRQDIVAVIESINSPMVAAGARPLESAKSFIVGIRNPSGLFSIFIYLHLIQSRQCVIYLHEPAEIPMELYHDTELEALNFVESMGFMVDNLNIRKLTPEQQEELLQRLPFLYQDLEAFAQSTEAPDGSLDDGDKSELELTALEEDVIELADLVELTEDQKEQELTTVSEQGLAKIARLLSSF